MMYLLNFVHTLLMLAGLAGLLALTYCRFAPKPLKEGYVTRAARLAFPVLAAAFGFAALLAVSQMAVGEIVGNAVMAGFSWLAHRRAMQKLALAE